ncbi:unnamed protein product [Phyllotreta striolata]|uniref:Uncharacterized protein n=1 Tax=Phyllotreta striolata TaxID=444603 RepID=A0A9N9XKQ4_PHYSR|nr:unnamed protein product [Phyllotreta striolata]
MFPSNFMNVMKKIGVTTEPGAGNNANESPDGGTTFGKLKQTISSSLLTAQDKVQKKRPKDGAATFAGAGGGGGTAAGGGGGGPFEEKAAEAAPKSEPGKPPSRAGACRVCLKAFKQDDFSRTCAECHQRVCEDCASYSKLKEDEDPADWTCSVCRR